MAFDLSNTANAGSTTDADSYSFTSQSFGATPGAGETRIMALGVGSVGVGSNPSSITIGGETGSERVAEVVVNANFAEIWTSPDPTGLTSGTVFVAASGATGCAISLYRIIDASAEAPTSTDQDTTDVSGVMTLNVTVPSGGGCISCCQETNGGTYTWSGDVTEDYEFDIQSVEYFGAASGTTAGSPNTITITNSDTTPQRWAGVAAAWTAAAGGATDIETMLPLLGVGS